jgi:glycosyltransferase involved in cell wall biosynthesis
LKPELLFVSSRFLFPVDSGGKIRTTQILKGLRGGHFRVRLVSPGPVDSVPSHAAQINTVCDVFEHWPDDRGSLAYRLRRYASVGSSVPVAVASDRSEAGRQLISQCLARRPALVVFDFPHSVVLAPDQLNVPSVLFTHNVESWIFERHVQVARNALTRALWADQHRKMVRFERATLERFDTVIAVSEKDAAWFRDQFGIANVETIPTGVDLDYFGWQAPGTGHEIVFVGSMDWHANQDGVRFFLDEVWPLVVREVPDAKMKVIGRQPPARLVDAAPKAAWRFTGYVDDVRPHAFGSAAAVIPLRVGGGTRIKAYEAMAMGIPVVSTSIGVEGLPLEADRHYLCADDARAFARATVRLLRDPELRGELSRQARSFVESKYSNREVARIFEAICANTARRPVA